MPRTEKSRAQAEKRDRRIIEVLKNIPRNEASWTILRVRIDLLNSQLDRGLKNLVRLGVVEKPLYRLTGRPLAKESTQTRVEYEDMKSPRRRVRETIRDRGGI